MKKAILNAARPEGTGLPLVPGATASEGAEAQRKWAVEKIAGTIDGVKFINLTVSLRGCCELRIGDGPEAGEADLRRMYVAEESRRDGVGTVLMEAALHEAKSAGCDALFFSVRHSNQDALKFYELFGAEVFGGDTQDLWLCIDLKKVRVPEVAASSAPSASPRLCVSKKGKAGA